MPSDPAPPDAAVYGLDNVRLELPLAGIGSRTLAAAIDHCLLLLLQIVWLLAGLVLAGILDLGGWGVAAVGLGIFLLQWGYFALFEAATDGRTPGKLAVGLRVVSFRGGHASVAAYFVRNFLRTFDLALGLPLMAVDRRARRLGDLVAGTLVVHQREPEDDDARLRRHPPGWGPREVAVVESFLRRSSVMERARAERMAEQLLRWIERRDPEFWSEIRESLASASDPLARLERALVS